MFGDKFDGIVLTSLVTLGALISVAIGSGNNLVGVYNGGGDNHSERMHHTTTLATTGTQVSTIKTCTTTSNNAPITHSCPEKSRTKTATTTTSMTPHNSSSTSRYLPLDYSLVKSYSAGSFFEQFDFYTGADPTHGFVEYFLVKFSF